MNIFSKFISHTCFLNITPWIWFLRLFRIICIGCIYQSWEALVVKTIKLSPRFTCITVSKCHSGFSAERSAFGCLPVHSRKSIETPNKIILGTGPRHWFWTLHYIHMETLYLVNALLYIIWISLKLIYRVVMPASM